MVESGVATGMFTDLVGSTRMRDELGDAVADAIGASHDQIITDSVAASRGRLVKTLGDGALIVFDSSVDAVAAAQQIQEGVATYNDAAHDDRQIGVRIGINDDGAWSVG
jgi:class 3 adenylate cyclase